jgi:hypothetical protein
MTEGTITDTTPPLSDEALGLELMPDGTDEQRAKIVAGLTPKDRAAYERMIFVADELNKGRVPAGVIVTPLRR